MPAGKTLDELVLAVRAEIGDSTNPSMGVDQLPALRQTIARVQNSYYEDFDWPHLKIDKDEAAPQGERYFTFDPEVNFQRIIQVDIKIDGRWQELHYGIGTEQYNVYDSDEGVVGTPMRWQHYGENQFEVWPIPDRACTIRFRCIRNLKPLIAGTDTCDIDSDLIVLAVAAEMLARSRSEDAQIKLTLATARYNRLKGRVMKTGSFVLGGGLRSTPPGSRIRVPR